MGVHDEKKTKGWDNTAAGYVALMETEGAAPGLFTEDEIAAQFDEDGNAADKISLTKKAERMYLALDYAAVALHDQQKKIESLEERLAALEAQ